MDGTDRPEIVRAIAQGMVDRRVLRIAYLAADGTRTERDVEPLGVLRGGDHGEAGWYLLGWCRLRGAVRGFRLDRVLAARPLDEAAPVRDIPGLAGELTGIEVPRVPAARVSRRRTG